MLQTQSRPIALEPAPVYNGERMSFEEFLERADERHMEWVDGEVVLLSRASYWHQDLATVLSAALRYFVDSHDLGEVLVAPILMKTGARLSGREPDLVFIAKANYHRRRANYIDGPADLVVEIVSPESQARDRNTKYREYEQGGVREYWLIDPERREAVFYQLESGVYRMVPVGADGIYHSAVLDGLWLQVNWLWQKPLPKLMDVLRAWKLV